MDYYKMSIDFYNVIIYSLVFADIGWHLFYAR